MSAPEVPRSARANVFTLRVPMTWYMPAMELLRSGQIIDYRGNWAGGFVRAHVESVESDKAGTAIIRFKVIEP